MTRKILTYLAANIYGGALSLAVIPLMSRLLGPADYGRATMFVTFVWILNTTIGLNISATYAAHYKQVDKAELRRLVSSAATLIAINSTIAGVLVLMAGNLLQKLTGLPPSVMMIAVVGSFFNLFFLLLQSHQMITGGTWRYSLQQMANATLVAILTIVLLTNGHANLGGRVWALFIPYVAFGTYSLFVFVRQGIIDPRPTFVRAREVSSSGWRLMPHMAGVFLFAGIDRFVANDLAGARVAGIYLAAISLTTLFSYITNAVNRTVVPNLFDALAHDPVAARTLSNRILVIAVAFATVTLAGAFLLSPIVILFLGKAYRGAEVLFPWLLLAQVIFAVYTIGANVLLFEKRNLTLSMVTILSGAVSVGLMYTLYPRFGLVGLGYAQVSGYAVRCGITLFLGHRLLNARIRRTRDEVSSAAEVAA